MRTARNIILSLLVWLPLCAMAQGPTRTEADKELEPLLRRLDHAVEHCEQYRQGRERRIATLTARLGKARTWAMRNSTIRSICDEYCTLDNDSAIAWMHRGIDAAMAAGDTRSANLDRCRLAKQYIKAGYHAECLMTLDSVRLHGIDGMEAEYYDACRSLYGQMEFHTHDKRDKQRLKALANQMMKLTMAATKDKKQYLGLVYQQQLDSGQYEEALATCDAWEKTVRLWTHEYAIICFNRFNAFDEMNRQHEAMFHLLKAAICDVENANYEGIAIYNVSRMLKEQGDVRRAQTYIKYAYMAQTRFGGRTRDWAIHDLEDINARYLGLMSDKQRIVTTSLAVIGALFLVVLIMLVHTLRQHRKAKAQNERIKAINSQLAEANLIKEGYIGTFFGLCSTYIDQADKTIKKIGKLSRGKQYKELEQTMRTLSMNEDARDGLFCQFDQIFLSIFPDFIAGFNALIHPESRIQPKDDTKMTMALRVFALIRLGVDNSQQIATFLGLANSTVYNYRTKYRNEAIGDRTTFEERVKVL